MQDDGLASEGGSGDFFDERGGEGMLVSFRVKNFRSFVDRALYLRCVEEQGGEWENRAFFLQYDLRFGGGREQIV